MEKKRTIKLMIIKVILVLYDAFVVNIAFYMAIMIRFSMKARMHDSGEMYLSMFERIAPYYTICCLVLFLLFRLYSGVWRYIGFNDIKTLGMANAITLIFQILLSIIVAGRMPRSYYLMGIIIQFILMCIPRIAPRYLFDEMTTLFTNVKAGALEVPVLIVGLGENARTVQNRMEMDRTNIARPVCVVDVENRYVGAKFNGLPVVCGIDNIKDSIAKYGIKCVIIASPFIENDVKESIRRICEETKVELRDFIVGTDSQGFGIRLSSVLKLINGPFILSDNYNSEEYYENQSGLSENKKNSIVKAISVENDKVKIDIRDASFSYTPINNEWEQKYMEETGMDISFF